MSSTFIIACGKLLHPPEGIEVFPLEELPIQVTSPAWTKIEQTYKLTLSESIVLQNYIFNQQQTQGK